MHSGTWHLRLRPPFVLELKTKSSAMALGSLRIFNDRNQLGSCNRSTRSMGAIFGDVIWDDESVLLHR